MSEAPEPTCPDCGHLWEDHEYEIWYDEEGVDGQSCQECDCQVFGHERPTKEASGE